MALWGKKLTLLFSIGRKLEDGGMYVVDLHDVYPAGILVQAYNQATSHRYTLSVSEKEVGGFQGSRRYISYSKISSLREVY